MSKDNSKLVTTALINDNDLLRRIVSIYGKPGDLNTVDHYIANGENLTTALEITWGENKGIKSEKD